jgi:predicted O-methyltransferase YrrM
MRTIISEIPVRIGRTFRLMAPEIGYPWLTLGAIMEMEGFLTPDFKILELGSGGSTIFFSRRCKSVKSFEHSPVWRDIIKAKLPDPSNVTFVCGYIDELEKVLMDEPEDYDLALIDSGPTDVERVRAMKIAATKVKRGCYMVVDNYKAAGMRGVSYAGWKICVYDQFRYPGRGTLICIKR